jgi:uncharacterized protein UPF0158
MVPLSDDKIKDIAQDLDCGFICYINIQTGEHLTIPKEYDSFEADGAFDEDVAKVEKNKELYLKIEPPKSGEAHRIMQEFAYSLPDQIYHLKGKLIEALDNRKPFRNFKFIIDNSGEYREKWFAFREQQLIKFLKNHLAEVTDQD